jgi:TPR repeat protein
MKSLLVAAAGLLLLSALPALAAKERKGGASAKGSQAAAPRGCDPQDLEGCTAWAERQLAADPGDASFDDERKEAQGNLRTACAGGVLRACSKLADSLERLLKTPDDNVRIVTLRTRTCGQGEARDCEKLGLNLLTLRGVQDPQKAQAALTAACEAKRLAACGRLATLLEAGEAGPPDAAAGLLLREKMCDAGDGEACADAADRLGRGLTSKDPAKARALDEKACGRGRGASCWALAQATFTQAEAARAEEKKPLEERAQGFLRKGCDGGDGNSCWALSRLTSGGVLGPRDDEKAIDLMLLACAQGKGGAVCGDATVGSLRKHLPPVPVPPAPPRQHNWTPTLLAAGATLLAAGFGAQQALLSQSRADDLKHNPATDTLGKRSLVDLANNRSRALYLGAAGLAAVTVTFYFVF